MTHEPKSPQIFAAVAVLIMSLLACKDDDEASRTTPLPSKRTELSKPPEPAPPPTPSPRDRLKATEKLADALAIVGPQFEDTQNTICPGAVLLTEWSSAYLTWKDLMALPKTAFARVMKDSDAERGKRLCARGTIVEISVDRSLETRIYVGGISTAGMNIIRFAAVHSTGNLVERSPAHFCGIVTGKQSYSNAMGGTTHAVFAVGMFDLPENRKR